MDNAGRQNDNTRPCCICGETSDYGVTHYVDGRFDAHVCHECYWRGVKWAAEQAREKARREVPVDDTLPTVQ